MSSSAKRQASNVHSIESGAAQSKVSEKVETLKGIAGEFDKEGKVMGTFPELVQSIGVVAEFLSIEEQIAKRGANVDASLVGKFFLGKAAVRDSLKRLGERIKGTSASYLYDYPVPFYPSERKLLESASVTLSELRGDGSAHSPFANNVIAGLGSVTTNITQVFDSLSTASHFIGTNTLQIQAEATMQSMYRDVKAYLFAMERDIDPAFRGDVMEAPEQLKKGRKSKFGEQIYFLLNQGRPRSEIIAKVGCSEQTVDTWTKRLIEQGKIPKRESD